MAHDLVIALIADVHNGPGWGPKRSEHACDLLSSIVDKVNQAEPDIVVDLGDRIMNSKDPDVELAALRAVVQEFRRLRAPVVHMLGNHDVSIDPTISEALLRSPLKRHSRDLEGWHLSFFNASARIVDLSFTLQESDLSWLAEDLSATELPTIVFSHVPFGGAAMLGNFYFDRLLPGAGEYTNSSLARGIVRRHKNAVAVISAHVHWNRFHTLDGVHYLSIQSVTESFTTFPDPAGAWALLRLGPELLRVDISGRDGFRIELPVRIPRQEWLDAPERLEGESLSAYGQRVRSLYP
jgi:hypothetical protein